MPFPRRLGKYIASFVRLNTLSALVRHNVDTSALVAKHLPILPRCNGKWHTLETRSPLKPIGQTSALRDRTALKTLASR